MILIRPHQNSNRKLNIQPHRLVWVCYTSENSRDIIQAWQKHNQNEPTYLSCAVLTSNALDISISTRNFLVRVNQQKIVVLMFMSRLLSFVIMFQQKSTL